MTRSHSKALGRARSGIAVLGAATLIVAGVNLVAHAAGGADSLLLGKANKAERSTTLKNKGKGPALKLKAKKGPALSVNTEDLVKNLNAEMVGGSTAAELEPTSTTHVLTAPGAALATGTTFRQFSLPAGTYLMNLSLAVETLNEDWFVGCLAGDSTLFTTDDTSKVYAGFNMNDASPARIADSTRIVTVPAASSVSFGCIMSTADTEPITAPVPLTLVVRQLAGTVAGSSTPISVTVRQARAASGG